MYDPKAYAMQVDAGERAVRWARDMMASWELHDQPMIDEVALLWPNVGELESFWKWAVDVGGMDNFFSVPYDTMVRKDAEGSFGVRFEFLRHHGTDWRVEAMSPVDGEYPLHARHLQMLGNGCIVHVSYKLSDLELYEHGCRRLEDAGLVRLAEYENTYGQFSYWETLEGTFYFKPRVNLRDT